MFQHVVHVCVCVRLNWVCARFLLIAAVHKPFGHFERPLGVASQSMVPHLASQRAVWILRRLWPRGACATEEDCWALNRKYPVFIFQMRSVSPSERHHFVASFLPARVPGLR